MKQLLATQSVLLIITSLTYAGLTFYSLVRWNDNVSLVLVTGFAISAQEMIKGFFNWLQKQDKNADGRVDKDAAKSVKE